MSDEDDPAIHTVDAGWEFGLRAYRESPDKRHRLQATLENLTADESAMIEKNRDPRWFVQYSLSF